MVFIPGQTVAPPEQIRRRYGLFDAASGPLDLPTHGEGGGIRFVPLHCGGSVAYGIDCYEPGAAPVKPTSGEPDEVQTGVFGAMSTLLCGSVGYTLDEYAAKVRRNLEGSEQATVERALWTGEDYEGNSLNILSLSGEAEDIDPGYDTDSIIAVVAALERYAYTEQSYGGVAYLHAPVEVAAYAANAGLIVPESPGPGGRKLTPMGSVWAFGAYPSGSIIATGQTTVWRGSEIEVVSGFDQVTNEQLLVAERPYAVSFECFAGEASFDPLEVSSP